MRIYLKIQPSVLFLCVLFIEPVVGIASESICILVYSNMMHNGEIIGLANFKSFAAFFSLKSGCFSGRRRRFPPENIPKKPQYRHLFLVVVVVFIAFFYINCAKLKTFLNIIHINDRFTIHTLFKNLYSCQSMRESYIYMLCKFTCIYILKFFSPVFKFLYY